MKTILFLILMGLSVQARADSIRVACNPMSYDCMTFPGHPEQCSWGADPGVVLSIELQKTGSAGPNYEFWEGKFDGTINDRVTFHLGIYQRREATQSFNFVTTELRTNGVTVSATGLTMSEVHYLSEADKYGRGLHCEIVTDHFIGNK